MTIMTEPWYQSNDLDQLLADSQIEWNKYQPISKNCAKCGGLCPSGVNEDGLCYDCHLEVLKSQGQGECSFCKKENIFPPAIGSKATGSYYSYSYEISKRTGQFYRPVMVFNGYVCEMHASDVDWVKLDFFKR